MADLDAGGVDSRAVACFDDDTGWWEDFSSRAWFVNADLSSALSRRDLFRSR